MTKIKHPFDYLTEDDLSRIDEWLNHPNPTIDAAVQILGIDKIKLQGESAATQLTEIHLISASGNILNDFADFIFDDLPEFPESVELFELIPSPAPTQMLAAGEDAIIRIVIRYDGNDDQISEDIKKIVEHAKRAKLQIQFKAVDDSNLDT